MSQNDEKKNGDSDNFHVRFKPGQAKWLRERVNNDERNVPQVVKKIVDREMIKEELSRKKPRRR